MEARKQVILNDLQKAILTPVVAIIRRHHRAMPVKVTDIRDWINFWMDGMYPLGNPYPPIKTRDVEKVIQHCRNLPWPQTRMICSNGAGYYYPDSPEEIDPYILQLESRLRWIASNLRHAKRARREMALGTGTSKDIAPDMFIDPALQSLLKQRSRAYCNLLTGTPSVDNKAGGVNEGILL